MNITITVNLNATPELISLVQRIIDMLTPAEKSPDEAFAAGVAAIAASNPGTTTLAKTKAASVVTATVPPVVDETPATDITMEDLRKIATEKTQAGKRDALKKLLGEFGVSRVSDLKPEQFGAFKTKMEAVA